MIADLILFTAEHPLCTGIIIGAGAFGAPMSLIAWCLGYEAAMRTFSSWMRRDDPLLGEHPTLPHSIERRPIITTPGRRV